MDLHVQLPKIIWNPEDKRLGFLTSKDRVSVVLIYSLVFLTALFFPHYQLHGLLLMQFYHYYKIIF
jgi:hypothetical protein